MLRNKNDEWLRYAAAIWLVIIALICICMRLDVYAEDLPILEESKSEVVAPFDKYELRLLRDYYYSKMEVAKELSVAAVKSKLDNKTDIFALAKGDFLAARSIYIIYSSMLSSIEETEELELLAALENEEPYAAARYVHWYLDREGFNEVVIAGIIGNMMAEVGGQTLELQYMAGSNSFFGICQWAKPWGAAVFDRDLPGQLDYLMETMKFEFDTYGYIFKSGFNYEKFCELDSLSDAALSFAKCYERCGSGSYEVRIRNAEIAYQFFNSNERDGT